MQGGEWPARNMVAVFTASPSVPVLRSFLADDPELIDDSLDSVGIGGDSLRFGFLLHGCNRSPQCHHVIGHVDVDGVFGSSRVSNQLADDLRVNPSIIDGAADGFMRFFRLRALHPGMFFRVLLSGQLARLHIDFVLDDDARVCALGQVYGSITRRFRLQGPR